MEKDNIKFRNNGTLTPRCLTPHRQKYYLIFAIILILFLSACSIKDINIEKAQIKINNKTITAEIVRSTEAQARGLSERKNLKQDQGMLFVYNKKIMPTFWMKDMLFPIDIIWICDDEIVDLTENLPIPQNGETKKATPKEEINYVLEVNAGFIKNNNLKKSDNVEIILDH
jgi:uncharacterized membrane protein (UPF0127 family)